MGRVGIRAVIERWRGCGQDISEEQPLPPVYITLPSISLLHPVERRTEPAEILVEVLVTDDIGGMHRGQHVIIVEPN